MCNMKNSIVIGGIIISISSCISSCSNEVPAINNKESTRSSSLLLDQSISGIKYIILDGDTLDLKSFFTNVDIVLTEKDAFNVSNIAINSRMIDDNIIPMTYTGYQTFSRYSDKSYNVAFTKEIANAIGLNPDYSYRCSLYLAQLRIGYPSGMLPVELFSPMCGFKPGQLPNFASRGYELQLVSGVKSFVLSTYIFSVEEANAHPEFFEDVWAPCRPADIIWDFGLRR